MPTIDRAILAEIHIQEQTLREICTQTKQQPRTVATILDGLIAKRLVQKKHGWRNGSGKKVIVYAGIVEPCNL